MLSSGDRVCGFKSLDIYGSNPDHGKVFFSVGNANSLSPLFLSLSLVFEVTLVVPVFNDKSGFELFFDTKF